MARIDYPDLDRASPEFRAALGPTPLNIARMFGHAEPAGLGLLAFGGKLLHETALAPRLRELVILRICAHADCGYEAHQHARHARAVGVTDYEIDRVARRGDEAGFGPAEQAVLRFTDAIYGGRRADDGAMVMIREHLTDRMVVELILVVGFYSMICSLLENLDVEIEEE